MAIRRIELAGEPKPLSKPITMEQAWASSSIFAMLSGPWEQQNPDQLVRNKGAEIYRKMLRDPQVKAAYQLATDIMLSRTWRFERPEDTPEMERVERFFKFNVNQMLKGAWLSALGQILSSKATGFSICEKVFLPGLWEGKNQWFLRAVKVKPFDSFSIEHDEFGNIKSLIQQQGDREKRMDPRKFVIHVTNSALDPVWGESDLRAAYAPYWRKTVIEKFWAIYLERVAGGFVKAKVSQPLSPTEKTNLENVLQNLSFTSSLIHPAGVEIEFENPTATDAFEKAVKHLNSEIARALLAPNLLGLSEQGRVGSFAQAEVQLNSYFLAMTRQGKELSDTVNEQIFAELAKWNFGVDEFPQFTFDPFTEEQKRKIAEAWGAAVKNGIVLNTFSDETRTRDLLGYDQRLEDAEPAVKPEDIPGGNPIPSEGGPPAEVKPTGQLESAAKKPAVFQAAQLSEFPWRERVDFQAIAEFFDRSEAVMGQEIAAAVDFMVQDAAGSMAAAIADNATMEDAVSRMDKGITPNAKRQLNSTIERHIRDGYEFGRQTAITEISRASAGAEGGPQLTATARWSKRRGWKIDEFNGTVDEMTAEGYFRSKAFTVTGVLANEILEKAKMILLAGIRDEKAVADIVAELMDVLGPAIGEHDSAGRRINLGARLETIVRTNLSEAFNQALLSVFTDPDLDGFVKALEYNATLDSRTTDFCRSYNGKIFEANSSIWASITPPNHHNCRSRLVPVTELDQFQISKPLPLEPQPGFG